MTDLDEIFVSLGLNKSNGLYLTNETNWKTDTAFPNRVQRLIERKIEPDAFFCFDNKPLILFFKNPHNKEELHKNIWNFNECPIVIIIENSAIEIWNGFNYLKDKNTLELIGGSEKLNDFRYFELVTGKVWETYGEHFVQKNRVDYHLLGNIKAARNILVEEHELDPKVANSLIGKCIFVRYLIDRKVKMKFDDKLRTWSNIEFCELLNDPKKTQQFFDYLEDNDRGFNGDLFPLTSTEYKKLKKADFQILRKLLQGEDIGRGQLSLFELYNFSIIPIEFISNVYELFIGQDNQEKDGAYYTPLFLVDYILKETVEKHLRNPTKEDPSILSNEDEFSYCKVLDPACGSGIFLVETLRKIIEKYISDTAVDVKSKPFKTAIKNLALKNIYGIDKDLSAVQVAIFSIYLTLLDYLEPPGIETFKFPHLFNVNFFVSDFFDEEASFNSALQAAQFDFVLGNPPWKRGRGEKKIPLYVQYINNRRKKENLEGNSKIDIGNKEIAQAFVLRCSDFSNKQTKNALIVTSKVLYNIQSAAFRNYLLDQFFIEKVFELAPVRREVFDKSNDKAIAPACILFFNYANGANTDLNNIEHIAIKPSRFFSLFKVFTINRTDYKGVQQGKLKEFDWLWKILVYGSYLDFNYIRRLRNDHKSIKETITENKNLLIGQGVMVGGGDPNDAKKLIGKTYIETRSDIRQFWINPNNKKKWKHAIVHRVRNEELYKAPVLLITEGVRSDFKSVSAITYVDSVYTSSLTGIKGKDKSSINTLRQISGIINSSFFSYINLMTFSSSGIEREQSHDEEKLNVPYIETSSIHTTVAEIENLLLKEYNEDEVFIDSTINLTIRDKLRELDYTACDVFSENKEEKDLIEYSNEIIIPLIMKHKGYEKLLKPLEKQDKIIQDYASLFIKRFKQSLDTIENKFLVEIWYSEQIIGMFFKMVPASDHKKNIVFIDKRQNDLNFLSLLVKIGSEKITEKLFVQKDIRGFEKDDFYIFKPNEKKLWHKAIGHLDVNEFADAILKKGGAGDNV